MAKDIKQRLISGGAWAFGGRMLVLATGLLINGVLARLVTPSEMGLYFLILSLILFFSQLAQLGMMRTVVRLVSESIATERSLRARSAILKIFMFVLPASLFLALLLVYEPGQIIAKSLFNSDLMSMYMFLVAIWLLFFSLQSLLAETFRGFGDIRSATIFDRLLTNIILVFLFVYLWFSNGKSDIEQVLNLTIIACGISVLSGVFLLAKKMLKLDKLGEDIKSSDILAISLPLLAASLVPFLISNGGLWVLGAYHPHEEVAIFAAVTRLVALLGMPLLVVNSVVAPIIAELYSQGNKNDLEFYLRKTASLAGYAGIVMLLFLIVFGEYVLGLIYGEFYKEGYTILLILCFGMFVNVWSGSCGQVLMMTGGQKAMMYISAFCGVLMVISTLLVVKPYGAIGVALVTSLITMVQFVLFVWYARAHTGMWTHMKFGMSDMLSLKRPG